jgi:hypothetical protein
MRVEGDELLPHAQARLASGLHKLVVSNHDADDSGAMEWEEWLQAYGRLDQAAGLSGRHKRDEIVSVVRNFLSLFLNRAENTHTRLHTRHSSGAACVAQPTGLTSASCVCVGVTLQQPQQVRLSTTTKPATEMVVMWITSSTRLRHQIDRLGLGDSLLSSSMRAYQPFRRTR